MQLSSAQKCGDSGVTRLENSPTICIPPSFIDSPSSSSSSSLSLSLSSSYQGIGYWLFAHGCTGMPASPTKSKPRPARRNLQNPRTILHLANFYPCPAEKCSAQHIPDLHSCFKPPFPCAFIYIAGIHCNCIGIGVCTAQKILVPAMRSAQCNYCSYSKYAIGFTSDFPSFSSKLLRSIQLILVSQPLTLDPPEAAICFLVHCSSLSLCYLGVI